MARKNTSLGQWLDNNGVSAQVLAERVGVSQRTLRRWAEGGAKPPWQKARAIIAATLGALSYEDFYGDPLAEPATA